jgi:diguanylate cyclase (GGDEF)-like protein/PAS domain S-box-containing protein
VTAPGWSTQQLAEFLEALAVVGDPITARRAAVDRVAQALDAELAAIVTGQGIEMSIGLEPDQVSAAALLAIREGRSKTIEVPGLGRCMALSVTIRPDIDASLIVARTGQERFSSEELNVARGLAHALAMAERLLEGRDEERALRQQSEEQAHERNVAEASYRSLVERLPAIVYSAEPGENGRWTYVSPQIEAILGFTPEEWMADPGLWVKQIHPDDRERAVSAESEVTLASSPSLPALDYRMLSRDGKEVWILDEGVLEYDPDGKPMLLGILYDITERKRVEGEVERQAAQQAAIAQLGERALKGAELQALMEDAASFLAAGEGVVESCVWEFEGDEGRLVLRACAGNRQVPETSIAVGGDTPAGLALLSTEGVTVGDWSSEERFPLPPYLGGLGIQSTIAVGIESGEQPLGVLEVHADRPDAFSSQDTNFAQSAANVLAHAIERRVAGEAIRHGSLHDHVTGLPNRALFVSKLEHAIAAAQGRETPLGVFFLDLDHFKVINDSLGHEGGDEILKGVVPRLRRQLRSVDSVARFGGDEFAILVEEVVDEAEAARIAERICSAFKEPFTVGGLEHHLSASVGIAVSEAADANAESLIRDAHAAMYRAKDRGRNRAEPFDQEMRSKAVRRLQMERELRSAFENEQLSLHYQPIVALGSGEILALEALLRWQHPERGMIGPIEFIPVAEESGLIHPIGRWAIERACQQSIAWHHLRPDARPIDITVNLSARQFAQRELPDVVANILERTGLDSVHLKFEITESVLVEKTGGADEILRELSRLGVQLILDDFGTGYSSLAYLDRFPLDAIKIDRSFIEGLGIEAERSAIVEAIIGLARALGLRAIAEGVENEVQLAELRRLGCGYAQGFLFSGPLQVADMTALLERAVSGSPFSLVPPADTSLAPGDIEPLMASERRAQQTRQGSE